MRQGEQSKSKAIPLVAMQALMRRGGIAPTHLTSALDDDESLASRPGRDLPQEEDPRYPLYRRLGGPQSRSGHRG
jgi:hypothetical protein